MDIFQTSYWDLWLLVEHRWAQTMLQGKLASFFLVKAPLLRSEALIRLLLKTSTQLHVHYVSHSDRFLSLFFFFHFVTEWKFSPQGRVNAILKQSHPFEEWCCTQAFSGEKAPAHLLLNKKKKVHNSEFGCCVSQKYSAACLPCMGDTAELELNICLETGEQDKNTRLGGWKCKMCEQKDSGKRKYIFLMQIATSLS